jgi:hypothetical protein
MTSHHAVMAGGGRVRAGSMALALIAVLAAALTLAARADAASVPPVYHAGNPTCADLDPAYVSLKQDSPAGSSDYSLDDGFQHVDFTTDGANKTVDWTSAQGIDAVIVKGGPNANVYFYDNATSDTDLTTPTNPNNGTPYGLSHVDFCYGVTPGRVVVKKQTDPTGAAQEFPFSTALSPDGFTLSDGGMSSYDVQPGTYTVSEGDTDGWLLESITCDAGGSGEGSTATFVVGEGKTVTCTFHNVKLGKVRVVKKTVPAGDPTKFTFDPSDDLAAGTFPLGDGDPAHEYSVKPGTYGVTEAATDGWKLDSIGCDDGNSTGLASTATYQVGAGEVVTCTFTNSKVTTPVTTPDVPATNTVTGTPGDQQVAGTQVDGTTPSAPPGAVVVKGTTAKSASAKIRGPQKCVSGRYTVAVSGGPIARVAFYLNGKKVRTLKASTGQRTFTLAIDARKAGAHAQRITAKVTFAPGATKQTKTLNATALRCSPGSLNPQFTG